VESDEGRQREEREWDYRGPWCSWESGRMSGDGADEVSLRACQGGMDAQRGQRQLGKSDTVT